MVASLIAAFPSGPSTRDAEQNVALHLAVASGANVALVRALLSAFPAGVLAANADGELPVQRLASSRAYDEDTVVELAQLLAFPLECEGQAENWFYLLELEERRPTDAECTVSEVPNRLPIVRMVNAVLNAASERCVTIEALAYAKDKKGRRAIDMATAENQRCLWKLLFLLGRYEPRRLLHQSDTSRVWEVEDKEAKDEEFKVLACKQVGCGLHFAREISLRRQHELSDKFVVQLIREHPEDRILLMPHCECSLEHALCAENFAGMSVDLVRSIAKQLVAALIHIHSVGVVHGDVKAKNICRLRGAWKLIDFDAAAAVGGTVGSKIAIGQKPANMPPELAKRVFRANFPADAVRAMAIDDSARATWEGCLAGVEQLAPEGPDPAACTLSGVVPSFDIWGLGLLLYRLFTAFRLFNANENDELDEVQLRELVLWRGIDRIELRKKVFARAEPGTVACSEKDSAVELIAACLQPDPKDRPQSGQELLEFEYFLPRGSGALRAKLLFVSTPGRCFNPRTGKYDFDLMGWLQKLCRHFAGGLVVAYDWAGSSSADTRDKQWFDRIFEARNSRGQTLFEEWTAAPVGEKETIIDAVQKILHETRWLASYRGSIKAQIRETCQSGAKAILVRFDGGPITRVEARIMAQLMGESMADLQQLGVPDPTVEHLAFDSVHAFAETALADALGEIYGEPRPIPAHLLAELPRAVADPGPVLEPGPSADMTVGTRIVHPVHGPGAVVKFDSKDPRGRPIHVLFDSGEIHHYTLESASKKLRLELEGGSLVRMRAQRKAGKGRWACPGMKWVGGEGASLYGHVSGPHISAFVGSSCEGGARGLHIMLCRLSRLREKDIHTQLQESNCHTLLTFPEPPNTLKTVNNRARSPLGQGNSVSAKRMSEVGAGQQVCGFVARHCAGQPEASVQSSAEGIVHSHYEYS
jgi:serine/threonine protein kinase